ncbi:hypothetical protein [Streptococcus suis]|nr:hypothetical protein [Streptococcus suis]HEM4288119.1 hypothetical protein [Streptococcus suis]HEM5059627.1 hypothetical protein [Streptococcus suis]HEM5061803.1 hypothetical protein [Streptococcus suis]HEM5064010.1 hypothetical protein [Streptococcus suis]
MKVDRRNAVSSWSGYNHQGKVFSSNLEYIDYENTVRKLKEDQDSDE